MKYTQPSFTEPVSTGKITDEQYEIAVGVRCPRCRKKLAGITGWCGCNPLAVDLPFNAISRRKKHQQ